MRTKMATFVNEDTAKAICQCGITTHKFSHPYFYWESKDTLKHKTLTTNTLVNVDLPLACQIWQHIIQPAAENVSVPVCCTLFLYPLTFVAVSDCVKVHIILLIGEEKKAEPGVKGIDGDNEEDPDYVPLFIRRAVVTQVHVDLKRREVKKKVSIKIE